MLLGGRPRAAPTPLRLGRQRGNSRLREPARQRQSILAGFAALLPVRAPFAPVRWAARAVALALTFAFTAPAFAQVSVSITSTPANGTHYVAGEAITTRLTIPQLNSGDVQNARMKLNIGGVERQAASTTGYAFRLTQVNFSYTVVGADLDTDGISIPANSIVGAGIWRTGGLTAVNRSHGAIGNQSSHRVFGTPFYISARSPATLMESNLNGATVTVSLVGHTFASGVSASSFALVSAVNGLSVSGITGRVPQHQRHPARWP